MSDDEFESRLAASLRALAKAYQDAAGFHLRRPKALETS